MSEYKIGYTYTSYADNPDGEREQAYDIYEAENAQDAVNQCREDFYLCNELDIMVVYKKGFYGWDATIAECWE